MKLFFLLILFWATIAPSAQAQQRLSFSRVDGAHAWIALQVLEVAYGKLGIVIEARILPSARSLEHADTGLTDGEVTRVRSVEGEYQNLIRIPVHVVDIVGGVVSWDRSIKVDGWESLSGYRIGFKLGAKYAEQGTLGLPSVYCLLSRDGLYGRLRTGGLDGIIETKLNFLAWRAKKGWAQLRWNDPPLEVKPLFHFLHRKHARLALEVTRVLREMEMSGELEQIRLAALAEGTERVMDFGR